MSRLSAHQEHLILLGTLKDARVTKLHRQEAGTGSKKTAPAA
jgi:hypothetical protein